MCYPLSSLLVVRAVKLMFSVDMMLLSITFIYTGRVCGWMCVCVCVCVGGCVGVWRRELYLLRVGYELNFWSGVYGTAVGRTGVFNRANVGLAGLFIGLGEIVGRLAFTL